MNVDFCFKQTFIGLNKHLLVQNLDVNNCQKLNPFYWKLKAKGWSILEVGCVSLQPGGCWWRCSLAYSSGDQSSGIGYFISDLKIAKASNS